METRFQTSFIPKRPLITEQKVIKAKTGTSVLMIISTLIFIVSIAGGAFSIFWKNTLIKSQDKYKVQLAESEKRFNISLIENLKKINTKIDLSKKLLNSHLEVAEIFSIISQLTIENVRFSSFEFSASDKEANEVRISMRGLAKDYNSIAFQSDVFGSSIKYGKNKLLKNPVISDLSEDKDGYISFSFTASINPADLSYEKLLNQ